VNAHDETTAISRAVRCALATEKSRLRYGWHFGEAADDAVVARITSMYQAGILTWQWVEVILLDASDEAADPLGRNGISTHTSKYLADDITAALRGAGITVPDDDKPTGPTVAEMFKAAGLPDTCGPRGRRMA
jgi:hypothetical protein